MKKIAVLFILLIITISGTAFAGTVPAKETGFIQDGAGMFPAASLPDLEKSAAGSLYSFYIVTIDNLKENQPGV